eukprot:scaffold7377_cov257-Pinguiococcus_pyrenoidosus.AAC.6
MHQLWRSNTYKRCGDRLRGARDLWFACTVSFFRSDDELDGEVSAAAVLSRCDIYRWWPGAVALLVLVQVATFVVWIGLEDDFEDNASPTETDAIGPPDWQWRVFEAECSVNATAGTATVEFEDARIESTYRVFMYALVQLGWGHLVRTPRHFGEVSCVSRPGVEERSTKNKCTGKPPVLLGTEHADQAAFPPIQLANIAVQLFLGIPLEVVHGHFVGLLLVGSSMGGALTVAWTDPLRSVVGGGPMTFGVIGAHVGHLILNAEPLDCMTFCVRCFFLLGAAVAQYAPTLADGGLFAEGVPHAANVGGFIAGLFLSLCILGVILPSSILPKLVRNFPQNSDTSFDSWVRGFSRRESQRRGSLIVSVANLEMSDSEKTSETMSSRPRNVTGSNATSMSSQRPRRITGSNPMIFPEEHVGMPMYNTEEKNEAFPFNPNHQKGKGCCMVRCVRYTHPPFLSRLTRNLTRRTFFFAALQKSPVLYVLLRRDAAVLKPIFVVPRPDRKPHVSAVWSGLDRGAR